MKLPEAWIISVGNELLNGRIVNSNLTWLSKKLTMDGYLVRMAITVRDDCDDIAYAFKLALERGASLIVSTGGLGPTFDDMTSECLSKALGRKHVLNEEALRMVEEKYAARNLPLTEHRLKMAMMPEGARPIYNSVGTAPGVIVEEGSALIILLPGVPSEMMDIFERIEDSIKAKAPPLTYLSADLVIKGVPESEAAPIIEEVMRKADVYIKSHPSGHEVMRPVLRINVISYSLKGEEARSNLESALKLLSERMREKGGEVIEESKVDSA